MRSEMTECGACGALIYFLKSAPTDKNPNPKPNPINSEPSPNGTIQIYPEDGIYKILKKADAEKAHLNGEPLHISHFATCDQAKTFRSDKPKAAAAKPKAEPKKKATKKKADADDTPQPEPVATELVDVVKTPKPAMPDDLEPANFDRLLTMVHDFEIFGNIPYKKEDVSPEEMRLNGQLATLRYIDWLMAGDRFLWKILPKAFIALGKPVPEDKPKPTKIEENLSADYADGKYTGHGIPPPPFETPPPVEPAAADTTINITVNVPPTEPSDAPDTPPEPKPDTSMIPVYKDMLRSYRDDLEALNNSYEPAFKQAQADADAARKAVITRFEQENAELIETVKLVAKDRDECDETLRKLLIAWYKETGQKTYDSEMQVAVLSRPKIIDTKAALEWAKTNAPFCLMLNEKKFIETFKDDKDNPFIQNDDTTDLLSAKIATKLAEPTE